MGVDSSGLKRPGERGDASMPWSLFCGEGGMLGGPDRPPSIEDKGIMRKLLVAFLGTSRGGSASPGEPSSGGLSASELVERLGCGEAAGPADGPAARAPRLTSPAARAPRLTFEAR